MGKMKICYVENDRGNGRIFINRIGVAFEEDNGDWRVKLDAFPVSGEMVIRDYVPKGASSPPRADPPITPLTDAPKDDDIPF